MDRSIMLSKYNIDGIYFDQVGVWAMICNASNHLHVSGCPTAWLDNEKSLYEKICQKTGRKLIFISEYPNEGQLPYIHGALTVGQEILTTYTPVPLYPSIYHTHQSLIGWPDNLAECQKYPSRYLFCQLLPFVWGSQMGWMSYTVPYILKKHPEIVQCLSEATKLKVQFPEYLGYGKLLRIPTVESVPMLIAPTPGLGIKELHWPAILAGCYRHASKRDSAILVLANWTPTVQTGIVNCDLSELSGVVNAVDFDGVVVMKSINPSSSIKMEVFMKPYSVKIIKFFPYQERITK